MSPPGSEFSDCGQSFRTRHLGAVQMFHTLLALSQLLNHMVEFATEVPDFANAIAEPYRRIEVAFSNLYNLALKFRHDSLQIVANLGRGEGLVSVFVQQDHWREYVHKGNRWVLMPIRYIAREATVLLAIAR